MGFDYLGFEEAKARGGLRLVVVGGVPSPWSEAAKGLFHMKGLDVTAIRLDHQNAALIAWAGAASAPVARYEDEPPRSGWAEILLLAERLAPEPALLPRDAETRALAFGLCHELLGEQGLAWARREQLVHAGLKGAGGFAAGAARYLAQKYRAAQDAGASAASRVAALLTFFSERLKASESGYLLGAAPTAPDVSLAAAMALFAPLPPERCAMRESLRAAFESRDAATAAALDPALLAHRDRMYERHLAPVIAL
ncbi:MAG: hypothetical protein AAGM38_07930 [Pseudomonadota bacterium]